MSLLTIGKVNIIKTTELDYAIAEEFFGWKWLSWVDVPDKRTPGYPNECRVRMFVSGKMLAEQSWQQYWAGRDLQDATGDEPLHYRYWSSMGPPMVGQYSTSLSECRDVEKEIRQRKLFSQYRQQLAAQCGALRKSGSINEEKLHFANAEHRCIAALAVVGSKHVTSEPEGERK